MADTTIRIRASGRVIPVKAVDNGDGTYSLAGAVPDGKDVALGAKADAAVNDGISDATVIALLKGLATLLNSIALDTAAMRAVLAATTSQPLGVVLRTVDGDPTGTDSITLKVHETA